MMRKIAGLIAALMCGICLAGDTNSPGLHVHLPRTARISGKKLTLAEIGVIRGADQAMVKKAGAVAMGRVPWSGEKIVVNRRTILARLAASGIPADRVRLTGASKVTLIRDEKTFQADKLVQLAEVLLKKSPPGPAGCKWRLVKQPKPLAVSVDGDVKLTSRLADSSPRGLVIVEIVATADNHEVARTSVRFKLLYPMQLIIATRDIAPGEVITPKNVKIKTIHVMNLPPEQQEYFGKISAKAIPAGGVIRPFLLRDKTHAIVVKRNKPVMMKIERIGYVVTATGMALQDGRPGDLIKVRNSSSGRIVMATVAFDGTVSPLFQQQR